MQVSKVSGVQAFIHAGLGRYPAFFHEVSGYQAGPLGASPARSSYTKRRKAIREAMHPAASQKFESVWDALGVSEGLMTEEEEREEFQVRQVVAPEIGYGKPPPQTKSFAAETAAVTGESKQAINRATLPAPKP